MADIPWQKSSFSAEGANCVNVAYGGDTVLLRESDEPGVVLRVGPEIFGALLRRVKTASDRGGGPSREPGIPAL